MSFQLNSKNLFLTFSQCDYSSSQLLDNIKGLFGLNLEKCIVARELHEDGNPHLHAAICLKNPFRTRNARAFDDLVQPPVHPNIRNKFFKGWKGAAKYATKDGNFLTFPEDLDLTILQKKKEDPKTKMIATEIQRGASLDRPCRPAVADSALRAASEFFPGDARIYPTGSGSMTDIES